jgi:transcriptional regulator with XRE-family HTH domain
MEPQRRIGGRPPASEGDRRLAHHFRRLRKEARMPLRAVAEATGLTYQAIHRVESQKSRLSIGHVLLCAELFGVSVDAFFAPVAGAADPPGPARHGVGQDLFTAARAVPESMLRPLIVLSRALAAMSNAGGR